jgi:LysR family transcriptional regulator, glycine cleavage system transcriptional activator
MRHRLPPLNSLRLFEAAARHLSFKDAAEELLLTPSAVSHGIRSLEQWLGARLFTRTRHGLALTNAGVNYHPVVKSALSMLVSGSEHVSGRPARQQLAISAAPTFASRILVPLLARFREHEPGLGVVVDTSHAHAELGESGVDLAIRMGRGGWPGVTARPLLSETLVPVCSPQRYREFKDAGDLDELPLIHVTSVSEDWARWADAAGYAAPDPERGLRFDTIYMAFEAAARGLGIAIGRRPLVDVELKAGTLVPLWQREVTCTTGYWLVSRQDRGDEPAVRAFRDWLTSRPIAVA